MNDWWNAPCEPLGGCQTAFMTDNDITVWPVWNNPQDPAFWTVKVHHLKRDKWERISGFFCKRHHLLMLEDWEQGIEIDVKEMERTDNWAAKNGGRI